MEAIAAQFGVTVMTISRDLGNFNTMLKLKPAKTASNPKGAGRPKGGPKPERRTTTPAIEHVAASLVLDHGKTYEETKDELGLRSVATVKTAVRKEEGRREPSAERESLSATAQEKLDAAIRRHQAKLDASFLARVGDEVRKRIDEIVLPHWKKQIDEAKDLYSRRYGAMTKETFNTIRRALHPDSRQSISDRKLSEAFDAFMALEKYLLNEKDSPTHLPSLPGSWDEWERAKRAATAARRAARSAGRNQIRPQ